MAVASHTRRGYAPLAQRERAEGRRRLAAGLLLLIAIGSALALLVAGVLLAYGRVQHGDKVFAGVEAAGIDLGGETRAGAIEDLSIRFDEYNRTPIHFTASGQSFEASPEELGVRYDAQATADKAYVFGRTESLWRESRHWLDALAGGYVVEPVMTFDAATFARFMESHSDEIVRAPRDATFIHSENGVTIDPGAAGVAIDVDETYERFHERVIGFSSQPIEIATISVEPTTKEPVLAAVADQVQAYAGDPLELSLSGTVWQVSSADLMAMLHIDRTTTGMTVELDRDQLTSYVRALAPDAFVAPADASLQNDNGTFNVVAPLIGRKLDVAASVDAAMTALAAGDTRVELVTSAIQPNITEAAAIDAKVSAEQLIAQPLTVTWEGGTASLDPAMLAKAVVFDVNASRNPVISLSFDSEQMSRALALVANDVKVEGTNAELRWIDGAVQVRSPETLGRELDVTATVERIIDALHSKTAEIAIVTHDVQPAVTAAMAGSIQLRDRLQLGQTEYGSSSAARFHNVELAASRVNGAMVAPGQTFSFNAALGPVTYDSGYQTGYGIVATNGSISTIPSVGGGICQVATTVFQPVFFAGMPIETRSWHLYWIPRYGNGPTGMKGLDATVDPDYALDFQFTNTTNDWLALKAMYDGNLLTFELWGTNPGWEVQVDQPVISNVVVASQEMVYENSSELPAGQQVYVEHAENGFDAAIHRVVRKDGNVIEDRVFNSNYAPARNVTLVGTGQ